MRRIRRSEVDMPLVVVPTIFWLNVRRWAPPDAAAAGRFNESVVMLVGGCYC